MKPQRESNHFPPDLAGVLLLLFGPVVIAFTLGSFLFRLGPPGLVYLAAASAIIGISLLVAARLPLYRERRFLSFGPRGLDTQHRKLYWRGYAFIAVSMILFATALALPV